MLGPLDVHRELLGLDVPHEVVRLPRSVVSAEELPDVLGVPAAACVAVRFYETNVGLVGVLLPVDAPTVPAALPSAIGVRRLRRAAGTTVSDATDFVAALAAPVLLPPGLPLFADRRLTRHDVLYTATGDGGTALKVRTAALLALVGARVADIVTASPQAAPAAPAVAAVAPAR